MPGCCNLGFLPLSLGVLSCATFVVSYIIAIYLKHVEPYFPYISDTGATSPESCIFGQFINMAAALAALTMFVRYRIVKSCNRGSDRAVTILNRLTGVLGAFSALGMSMVANFQENRIEPVHITGAALVFLLGVLYALLQTAISYRMYPDFNGLPICHVRLVMSLISAISMIIAFVAGIISRVEWDKHHNPGDTKIHWKPEDPGFTTHVMSTFSEWIMALSFVLYFFTYVREFQKTHLRIETVILVNHFDQHPVPGEPNEASGLLS